MSFTNLSSLEYEDEYPRG